MSWLEPSGDAGMALRCATYDGRRWSKPATIAAGDSFFVNWADFPSILPLGGNRLAAHWLWRNGAGTYAYDVRISQSEDGGHTWGPSVTPHRDGTHAEHGFVSLVADTGRVLAIWLDGRKMADHEEGSPGPMPDMSLRAAAVLSDNRLREEVEIDDRTCDCCQTAAVTTSRGVLVAYRDRSPDEVRDIVLARLEQGRWSAPYPLHPDGWRIAGCPVNGPALAAQGDHVAVVWFTEAADTPRVQVAFSDDGGTTFNPPMRVDDGAPLGRVHLTLLDDGAALVVWLEAQDKGALVRARRVSVSGRADAAFTVAPTAAARSSGFPRVTRSKDLIVFAWTESGKPSRVRTATLALRERSRP